MLSKKIEEKIDTLDIDGIITSDDLKKHLEKADDEFQISKNLREALNYYANNLYKENPLTII